MDKTAEGTGGATPSTVKAAAGLARDDDPLWFKDAVIYQTHVKAFFDSTNDGVGDFEGLIAKLDHVQQLGASAIWILPFYPSPLRDDGYDIQDYRAVNPTYGAMRDVRRLVREAHKRGLRVITELVINHTSDQHPWFQASRRAMGGDKSVARYRDYYVWSDTDQKYQDTRIIFLDTEVSNWTWDPVAKAYFWHRFYSHQPDLNFDNPAVMREVLSLLRFWLDMGIDGLRLDAIPYLIERDGTNCENLPETHVVLKRIRAEMDRLYPDRMLLAEANQWPEDTRPYFGDGDECHMAFHFPLMPRMYMAIAQEDRHPITDILRQTPEIPENCQWAIFLRNHDELTLEMVTERERQYLWNTYAADSRARINLGIRRRLAPLMGNDRRKIELMNALLFSMPGTPVMYYGDEIGMGDNIYLGDRDGVRTPMQWSPDRNGGFSRADPQLLYLPPVQDAVHGYQAVNVEAQLKSPGSLLNWTKRLIAVRQARKVFGRGSLSFLYPSNRKVLAYTRELEREDGTGEAVLCVFNLSRDAQAAALDLSEFEGRVPVELLGRSEFPQVGTSPYVVTLPGHGFYWFALTAAHEVGAFKDPAPEPLPEFVTLVLKDGVKSLLESRGGKELFAQALPEWLPKQRWFAAKGERVRSVREAAAFWLDPTGSIEGGGRDEGLLLAELEVEPARGAAQRYLLPLAVAWGEEHLSEDAPLLPYAVAKIRRGPKVGVLHDATQDDGFVRAAAFAMANAPADAAPPGSDGGNAGLRAWRSAKAKGEGEEAGSGGLDLPPDAAVRRFGAEQSNTSVLLGDRAMVKVYRRLQPGVHPELEIGRFLTDVAGFEHTPPLLGSIERVDPDGAPTALLAAFGFVPNQGDGWSWTLGRLDRALEEARLSGPALEEADAPAPDPFEGYLVMARLLGLRSGQMHEAFATPTDDPAFAPEPVTASDLAAWREGASREVERGVATLRRLVERGAIEDEVLLADVERLLAMEFQVQGALQVLREPPPGLAKTRLHGDYHLGQVLVARGDFQVIDFEGEPMKDVAERRAKGCPARDVAGMLRSFDYAAAAVLDRLAEADPNAALASKADAFAWRDRAQAAFLDGHAEGIGGAASWPGDSGAAAGLVRLFSLEKAFYEVGYEAANRPAWLGIPVRGVLRLFEGETAT